MDRGLSSSSPLGWLLPSLSPSSPLIFLFILLLLPMVAISEVALPNSAEKDAREEVPDEPEEEVVEEDRPLLHPDPLGRGGASWAFFGPAGLSGGGEGAFSRLFVVSPSFASASSPLLSLEEAEVMDGGPCELTLLNRFRLPFSRMAGRD